ncbi:MAG: hypothetical protein JXI32_08660 [Deltaproteobacteria bacterium]|nr:hypothetical protein [Deltaproteobacteria bacterium]
MKKTLLIVTLVVAAGLILVPLDGRAQTGPGYGPGPEEYGEWSYCPYCGQPLGGPGYGRGPAYERGPGYGRGYGMRSSFCGPQYGPMSGLRYQRLPEPLEEKGAREMLDDHLKSMRNPNLKLGKIQDRGPYFEAEVLTKDGSLADRLVVDKNTGWMRSVY